MQRRTFWLLHWLILSQVFYTSEGVDCWGNCSQCGRGTVEKTRCCMETYSQVMMESNIFNAIEILEGILEETEVQNPTPISVPPLIALLQKPPNVSRSIEIYANDTQVISDGDMSNRVVRVQLPAELHAGVNNTIVFCMIQLLNETPLRDLENLFGHRLIGVSVGRKVTGLHERVNITINIMSSKREAMKPKCMFLNTTAHAITSEGCEEVEYNQTHVTCSCDHLTYFGVLMVSADLSAKDQEVLSYITYIGCGISLTALIITVLLFITNKKVRGDDSKKIHISLAVSLLLLNIHFLPSQAVAAMSSNDLCLYVALLLHYSLLASFTWMAVEGFHLYLLLVKVFNIYVRRYLLKLSVVGWGLPAVIVTVMVITDKDLYGRTPLDSSNETEVCYITNDTAKMVTTVGVFGLVFLFNLILFGVIIKIFMGASYSKERRSERNAAKNKIFTLLVLAVLLGLTWGLIFFSLGHLNTPVLYIFCIMNSLQGLFIFVYFVFSLKKTEDSAATQSTDTRSHSSKT
ncbi:adhesion G-protein coupled receptor G2-like isoform 2-T2 [Fundulus diaphanus]